MKKIGVVTATRAEYGLLKRIMGIIRSDTELMLRLYVTGTHLLKEFGHTVDEIRRDGFEITAEIEILDNKEIESEEDIVTEAMAVAVSEFGKLFRRDKPDMLIILGDRYELLPIGSVALIYNIPIAHINGGEVTEGAIDDTIRHCITKMSYLHFTACEQYKTRVIQLGEDPKRVFNVGDTGVENVEKFLPYSKDEMQDKYHISFEKPCASVTFHPVTREDNTASWQIHQLLEALAERNDMEYIITMANADAGGRKINQILQQYAQKYTHIKVFASLGMVGYLSLLYYAKMVIGNSSSGIIEAPSMGIPTVNIGERQKGRLRGPAVIDCEPEKQQILTAIAKASDLEMGQLAKKRINPYSGGNSAEHIVRIIKNTLNEGSINLKKSFYDLK